MNRGGYRGRPSGSGSGSSSSAKFSKTNMLQRQQLFQLQQQRPKAVIEKVDHPVVSRANEKVWLMKVPPEVLEAWSEAEVRRAREEEMGIGVAKPCVIGKIRVRRTTQRGAPYAISSAAQAVPDKTSVQLVLPKDVAGSLPQSYDVDVVEKHPQFLVLSQAESDPSNCSFDGTVSLRFIAKMPVEGLVRKDQASASTPSSSGIVFESAAAVSAAKPDFGTGKKVGLIASAPKPTALGQSQNSSITVLHTGRTAAVQGSSFTIKLGIGLPTTAVPEERRIRMDPNQLQQWLFELFQKKQMYSFEELSDVTKQPETHLRAALKQIAERHTRGENLGKYELRPEYKLSL